MKNVNTFNFKNMSIDEKVEPFTDHILTNHLLVPLTSFNSHYINLRYRLNLKNKTNTYETTFFYISINNDNICVVDYLSDNFQKRRFRKFYTYSDTILYIDQILQKVFEREF